MVSEFCVAWRNALRRVINIPYDCHSCFIRLLSGSLPIFDELFKHSIRFFLFCVFRGFPVVRAVAHHALNTWWPKKCKPLSRIVIKSY